MGPPNANWRSRLAKVLKVARREPTEVTRTRDVRIKLEALPAPLRAIARAQVERGLLIEAELPWLTVGSGVEAELPEGTKKGRIHWFGVDATRAGAARLRVFVDLAAPGSTPSAEWAVDPGRLPGLEDLRSQPRSSAAKWIAFALVCSVASFAGGWLVAHRPLPARLPSLVEPVSGQPPNITTVPKQLPETESPVEEPSPPPPPAKKVKSKHGAR